MKFAQKSTLVTAESKAETGSDQQKQSSNVLEHFYSLTFSPCHYFLGYDLGE